MVIIVLTVKKNYKDSIGHIKFEITDTLCSVFRFTCIMEIICNFPSFLFYWPFGRFFFRKCNNFLHLGVVLTLLLLSVTYFSFQSQLNFSCVLLKIYKLFSYFVAHDINYHFFQCDLIQKLLALNIHLFLLLNNFLDYFHIHLLTWRFPLSMNIIWHFIRLNILAKSLSWCNYSSITVFIFTYFFMWFRLIFCFKTMKKIQAIKVTIMLFLLVMQRIFLLQVDNISHLLLPLRSVRELLFLIIQILFWKTCFFFFNIQNIRINCRIIFSDIIQSSFFDR